MSPAQSSTPLTPVVFHVLLALSDGPLHGYGIMKQVEAESGQAMGPGTVYGAIRRLHDADWVAEAGADASDARRGRTFALTEDGRAALRSEARRIARLARLDGVRRLAPESGGT